MRTKEKCVYWDEKEGCIHPAFPGKQDPIYCRFYWDKDWPYGVLKEESQKDV